ncbi:predicted protein [Coccidioides posadasii str. Silveira]|uniref:Predicted protein n=1 Tax=Coccidioides posadasii (strain RMSCC 757 / Silveira) TaxID=443226 RepID=E9CTH4_COCPS|nr:predicted protein [Coccidioides posadasii str. Silveira]
MNLAAFYRFDFCLVLLTFIFFIFIHPPTPQKEVKGSQYGVMTHTLMISLFLELAMAVVSHSLTISGSRSSDGAYTNHPTIKHLFTHGSTHPIQYISVRTARLFIPMLSPPVLALALCCATMSDYCIVRLLWGASLPCRLPILLVGCARSA